MRREFVTKSTSGGCGQFETSPEEIEQEMRTALCERRQTDLRQMITAMCVPNPHDGMADDPVMNRRTSGTVIVWSRHVTLLSVDTNRYYYLTDTQAKNYVYHILLFSFLFRNE